MPIEVNRLFFALWPTDAVRAACAEAARTLRMRMQPLGHPIPAERYHITLLFLGDRVSPQREAALRQAAGLVRAPPFRLELDHAGSFRKARIPWWLGTRHPPEAATRLHDLLRDAALRVQLAPERTRFVPHLTVLRDAGTPLPPTQVAPIVWDVDQFVLVRSRIDRSPVEYELLERWPLRASADPAPDPQPDQLTLPL